jgi:hypothetical protein
MRRDQQAYDERRAKQRRERAQPYRRPTNL